MLFSHLAAEPSKAGRHRKLSRQSSVDLCCETSRSLDVAGRT
jgi:hypothetical protein